MPPCRDARGRAPFRGSPARARRAAAPRKVALGLEQAGEVVEAPRRIGMLGAEHLFAYRQRALEERPRPRKVALAWSRMARLLRLSPCRDARGRAPFRGSPARARRAAAPPQGRPGPEQEGEVVEARRRIGMLGAERLFAHRQRIAKQRRGLGVSCAARRNSCRPVQKTGPVCNVRSVIEARFAPRKQMRRELAHSGHDCGSLMPSSG